MEIAFEAYTNRLKQQGFEGNQLRLQQQRFYLAYAHLWQAKYNALYAQELTQGRNELGAGKMDFLEFLGFGHDNYRKHAPFFGKKSTIFAPTFGYYL